MKEIPLFPTFIRVTLEHKDEYYSHLKKVPKPPCNSLFMTLIIYDKDNQQIKLCKLNGNIIILVFDKDTPSYFGPIIGNKNVNITAQICMQKFDINFLYFPLSSISLPTDKLNIINDRDNYDYLYKTDDLIYFKKSKMHRINLNRFISKINYLYKSIKSNNTKELQDIILFYQNWFNDYRNQTRVIPLTVQEEYNAFYEMLKNIDTLDLKIGSIYVNGKIAGFTIGSIFNNTGYIHLEKCIRYERGSYQAMIHEFGKDYFENVVETVNREEDLGIDGLRRNKQSYKPYDFVEKIVIRNF